MVHLHTAGVTYYFKPGQEPNLDVPLEVRIKGDRISGL